MNTYCISRFNCVRLHTREVMVGNVGIGGNNPIRIQSMTNTKTQDINASLKQCIQLAEAGCEIIRLTAQNLDAAKALGDISKNFKNAGFHNPLVADIHFLPQTAMEAVKHVEKIRVNPGNFSDKKKNLPTEYTDSLYMKELETVREKFEPLVLRCKELGRAIRIGTNHGSLSDRIISRYGDTSLGMVEAAFEFARICSDLDFHNFIFSFKASNTKIMTQTYKLAAQMMIKEGFSAPLHLGVTEAGFGEDARIKSAIGIGSLLLDGLGDTIRVSLTEDPVQEIPVAREFVSMLEKIRTDKPSKYEDENKDFYNYSRRKSDVIKIDNLSIGGDNTIAVAVFNGISNNAELCFNSKNESSISNKKILSKKYLNPRDLENDSKEYDCVIAEIPLDLIPDFEFLLKSKKFRNCEIILKAPTATHQRHHIGEARAFVSRLKKLSINLPILISYDDEKIISAKTESQKLNEASVYLGSLLCDGIGDIASVKISENPNRNAQACLAILQGARARKSKAEYIACPSCGRTLYNIQEAATKIEAETSHLKGITIGIMGCIVNGPGEMADADFGYVGGAPNKINLYKGRECVATNIPENEAIEKLIALIKDSGKWIDKPL